MKVRTFVLVRTLLAAGIVAALVVPFSAFGGTTNRAAARTASVERQANLYEISQIEVKFHRATSTHNLNLMMSLWAPGAVFNIDQQTLTGKAQIRHWFATENPAFMPKHHWESTTPSYKEKIHLTGDKASLYFECVYINPNADLSKARVMAIAGVTHQLQKIGGQWLIVDSSGSPAYLSAGG
jgi:ketosteroid isomerase-like protein